MQSSVCPTLFVFKVDWSCFWLHGKVDVEYCMVYIVSRVLNKKEQTLILTFFFLCVIQIAHSLDHDVA
jgi:hypothetical protein